MKHVYIFGYGSLLSHTSRKATAPNSSLVAQGVYMRKSRRICNVSYGEHVYLNVTSCNRGEVRGVVFAIGQEEFEALSHRERHYDCCEVTHLLNQDLGAPVYAFIGYNNATGNETIKYSYLETCLEGLPPALHDHWLEYTELPYPIDFDA